MQNYQRLVEAHVLSRPSADSGLSCQSVSPPTDPALESFPWPTARDGSVDTLNVPLLLFPGSLDGLDCLVAVLSQEAQRQRKLGPRNERRDPSDDFDHLPILPDLQCWFTRSLVYV